MYDLKGKDGTVYTATLITREKKTKLEYALYKLDVESVTALKDILPDADYQKKISEKATLFHKGFYKLTGPFIKTVMGSEACTVLFVAVLFGMANSDEAFNMLLNVDNDEAIGLIELVMRKSFPQITDAQWDAAKQVGDPEKN